MTNPLTQLLSKKMTRKEFLLSLGALIVGLIGISNLIKSFMNVAAPQGENKENKRGFGTGSYGL